MNFMGRKLYLGIALAIALVFFYGRQNMTSGFVDVSGIKLHYMEVNKGSRKATVVLLHGQAFQASTWQETGTLAALGKKGVRAVAVDLPGHGATGGQMLPLPSRPDFLAALLQALQVQQPLVIVSPSMSGSYVLPWMREHGEQLAGWVPVAPVGLRQWAESGSPLPPEAQKKLKVLAVYGERDRMKGDYSLIEDAVPRAQFLLIPKAGHPCYLHNPDLFNTELSRFLDNEITA